MKESVNGKNHYSMKWKIMGILMLCWLIPFTLMFAVMGIYVATNHSDMTAENFQKQLEFNNKICRERLNSTIAVSRQASYDRTILNICNLVEQGKMASLTAGKNYNTYLEDHYQKSEAISCAFLWMYDNSERIYSVYSERANGSYQKVLGYQNQDHESVKEYAKSLGTKVGFLVLNNNLYLVRNLVDSKFEEKGALIFNLNQKYCFNSLTEYPSQDGVHVKLSNENVRLLENENLGEWIEENSEDATVAYDWKKGRLYVTDIQKDNDFTLKTTMLLMENVTQFPFYGYQYIVGGLLLSLLPLLLVMMRVFKKQVSDPVAMLSDGAAHIEDGEIGYQIPEITANAEFAYLRENFNEMSSHLKQQFDRIYQEEIALREARIMALQSHINPHFMNNTLEIINWEARLSGNTKVSRMIEALSTMMDAAMDRKKRPEVRLAEEMRYVNSYLYITKERLGKRLTVEIDIPEELMDYLVPRLILQPVVENAIEHGVVPNGSGKVIVRGYCDEKYLYLETVNDGGLSAEDREKISRLLDPQYTAESETGGSMGIANVNQRLRIFFGEPCGLAVEECTKGRVTARLVLPLQK